MELWFALIALALVTVGGLTAAIDAAYSSLSRNDVASMGEGTPRARTFDRIAADIPGHLNALNFVRVLCETFAAILVSLAFISAGFNLGQTLIASAAAMAIYEKIAGGGFPESAASAAKRVLLTSGR